MAGGGAARVLVVEDHPPLREFILMALEPLDLMLEGCADADAALARWTAGPRPDLLLTDLMLPRRSGLELVQALRQRPEPEAASLPVLLLTAAERLPEAALLQALGIGAVLRKPMAVASLHAAVRAALAGAPPRPGAGRGAGQAGRDDPVDRHFQGDAGLWRAFGAAYLARRPAELAAGRAALAAGDAAALRRIGHDLKGVALLLGHPDLRAQALRLEQEAQAWSEGRQGACGAAWAAVEAAAQAWSLPG